MSLFMSWWLVPDQKTLSLGSAVTDIQPERCWERPKQGVANPGQRCLSAEKVRRGHSWVFWTKPLFLWAILDIEHPYPQMPTVIPCDWDSPTVRTKRTSAQNYTASRPRHTPQGQSTALSWKPLTQGSSQYKPEGCMGAGPGGET